jgi:hypothetical protein
MARSPRDKKPKVFESVGTHRRIPCNIQTGLKTVNQRRQTDCALTLSDAPRPFSTHDGGARAFSYLRSGDVSGRPTDTVEAHYGGLSAQTVCAISLGLMAMNSGCSSRHSSGSP